PLDQGAGTRQGRDRRALALDPRRAAGRARGQGRRQEGHAGGGPGLSRIPLHVRGAGDRGPQLLPSAPRDRGPEVRVHVPQGPARHDRRGLRRLAEGAEGALRGRRRVRRDIPAMKLRTPRHRVLPGFGLALGFTLLYLSLVVLVPLSTLFWKSAGP